MFFSGHCLKMIFWRKWKTFQVNTNPLLKHTVTLSVVGDNQELIWLFFTLHSCHVCLHICRVVYLFLTIFSEPYTEIMGDSPGSTLYIDIRLEFFLNHLCWVEYFWDFIFFIWEICFGMKFVFPYPVLDITNWNCGMCLPAWLHNV